MSDSPDAKLKDSDLTKISVATLKEYLLDRGWVEELFGRKEVLKFNAPRDILVDGEGTSKVKKPYFLLVPSRSTLIDYTYAVRYTIEGIATFEKLTTNERRTPADVMRDLMEKSEGIAKREAQEHCRGVPIIQVYSPYTYRTPSAIVLNKEGKKALIKALQKNEPEVAISAFVLDGEGFDLRILTMPESEIRNLQDPYQHDWKDLELKDPRDFNVTK